MAETTHSAALAVVVIGRNEAANLARLAGTLTPLLAAGIRLQRIFVDSASTDATLQLARQHFDTVMTLPEGPGLCAALGRYHGTEAATAPWILYLDGDMALEPAFVSLVREVLETSEPDLAAVFGRYTNVHPDGSTRDTLGKAARAGQFGGALLARRAAVTDVGNWNPHLFANEEIDLAVRLRAAGRQVRFHDLPMVRHYTDYISRPRQFLYNLWPVHTGLGKKFYGFGQLLAAHARAGSLGRLLRFHPWPFLWWACLLLALLLWPLLGWQAALLPLLAGACLVANVRGLRFTVLYTLMLIHAIAGYGRLGRGDPPAPGTVWTAGTDPA